MAARAELEPLAVPALILALIFPLAPVGTVMAHMALRSIKHSNGKYRGHTLALIAAIIGWIFSILLIALTLGGIVLLVLGL